MKKNHILTGISSTAVTVPSIVAAAPILNMNSMISGFSNSHTGIDGSISNTTAVTFGIILLAVGLIATMMTRRIKKQPVRMRHRSIKKRNSDKF